MLVLRPTPKGLGTRLLRSARAKTQTTEMGDGPAVDLRDARNVRAAYFDQLLDISGEDLKRVYEPITEQISYIFVAILIIVLSYVVWQKLKKWREMHTPLHLPYKVVKPPSSVVSEKEGECRKKRVCAVVGGTGFVGSCVVDELVQRGDYYVYVLGRKFRKERTNPNADALIQVDVMDVDGLEIAFQGVESVIDTAAAVPTVFSQVDDIWRINKLGLENVVKAAQRAGVKNFVWICGVDVEGKPNDPVAKAFFDSFYLGRDFVMDMDGKAGMRTCIISPAQIVGIRNQFWEMIVSGKMSSFPMLEKRASFMPVEYITRAIVNAEQKLAANCEDVAGKNHSIAGEVMTFKRFLALPTWPHKSSSMPMWVLRVLAKINLITAKLTGWAPMGVELSPAIIAFISLAEAEIDSTSAYEVLEIGPPPSMEDYITTMVERHQERQKSKK